MKTTILTVLTAATFALAGCAVDPTSSEPASDESQSAISISDRAKVALGEDVSLGGRGGLAVAADPQKRIYDFDKTPRVGQRGPYEADMTDLEAVGAVVPHAASDDAIARRAAANCGLAGCN